MKFYIKTHRGSRLFRSGGRGMRDGRRAVLFRRRLAGNDHAKKYLQKALLFFKKVV